MSWPRLIFIALFSLNSLSIFLTSGAQAETSWIGDLGLSAGYLVPAKSLLNPGNRVFETPQWDNLADFRGELKVTNENQKFVLRPRVTVSNQIDQLTDPSERKYRDRGKVDLTDAYFEWTPQENWQLTTGLMVDGWGPAEFVNPSNPFFHLNFQNKSFFYKEKGKVLIKALWNPSPKTTVALTAEPLSNREASFRAGQDFRPQAALRGEWQSDDASQVAGLLIGKEEFSQAFLAEYLQLRNDKTGSSVYMEARHSSNPERFEIQDRSFYKELVLQRQEGIQTYSVLGLRWEGRVDARLEWISYEQGYSETQWSSLLQSVTQVSPALISNAEKFSRSGLEFPSKNWWSLSLRTPDLGPWSDWQWTNRLLISVGDQAFGSLRSGIFQSDLEMPAYQAWTFLVEIQNSFGKENTELLLNTQQAYYGGAKLTW